MTIATALINDNINSERADRAYEALATQTLTVKRTRLTPDCISAYVTNGDTKEYGVTLTATQTFCSCPDAMYRGAVCKHALAVAITVRQEEEAAEAIPAPVHVTGAMPTLIKTRAHWTPSR